MFILTGEKNMSLKVKTAVHCLLLIQKDLSELQLKISETLLNVEKMTEAEFLGLTEMLEGWLADMS
jgi:hypothetical protein